MFQERMRRCASTVLGIQGMILLCYLGVARCWNFQSMRNQYAAGLRGCSTEEPFRGNSFANLHAPHSNVIQGCVCYNP